jgi:antitoxin CptB
MPNSLLFKKLFYRAVHRGCKETDFLLGEFAKKKLEEVQNLELFGEFLEENDWEIYDWILRKENPPKKYEKLVQEIQSFHKI